MKKLLALTLMFVLMFVITVPAFATDVSINDASMNYETLSAMTQEDIEALAREYFPEEYSKALDSIASNVTYAANDYAVASETKEISDSESITCLQLNSGRLAVVYAVNFYDNSTSSGSGYTTKDVGIVMTITGAMGVMTINGLNYTIYTNSYDRINSLGNSLGSTNGVTSIWGRQTESASGPATVTYSMLFETNFSGVLVNYSLQVYVGNNQRTYAVF